MQIAANYARAAESALASADENDRADFPDVADAYRADALVYATLAVAAATLEARQ